MSRSILAHIIPEITQAEPAATRALHYLLDASEKVAERFIGLVGIRAVRHRADRQRMELWGRRAPGPRDPRCGHRRPEDLRREQVPGLADRLPAGRLSQGPSGIGTRPCWRSSRRKTGSRTGNCGVRVEIAVRARGLPSVAGVHQYRPTFPSIRVARHRPELRSQVGAHELAPRTRGTAADCGSGRVTRPWNRTSFSFAGSPRTRRRDAPEAAADQPPRVPFTGSDEAFPPLRADEPTDARRGGPPARLLRPDRRDHEETGPRTTAGTPRACAPPVSDAICMCTSGSPRI